MSYHQSSQCIHLENDSEPNRHYGAISYPIYQTATYAHEGVGQSTGYDYSRLSNPTRTRLEQIVAQIEYGSHSLAFSSGMAAISTLFELFSPNDNIITDRDLYGGSIRLFQNISQKNGVTFTPLDLSKESPLPYLTELTRAIFLESPTNPMMNVTDILAIARIAREHRILLIVDNTFLSPYFQNPLELGADIVVHSGTKYLGGHNDTLGGFLVTADDTIYEKLAFLAKTTGAGLAPFDAWLILRGIKTLPLRMERASHNALKLAHWLEEQGAVKDVIYPGLPSHPGHKILKEQARGFGAMLTIQLHTPEQARHILERVKLIQFAESLGGVETLITYPVTQTHADVPEAIRLANGITDCTLRLSIGIEDPADLQEDLAQAFQEIPLD